MIEPYFSVFLALVAAISWGINSHVLKVGMIKQNPALAISIRSIFGFPVLIIIALIWKGLRGITIYFESDIFPYIFISSLLIIMGDGFFLLGLRKYPVNILLPIASVYPLFATVILVITGTEQVQYIIIFGTIIIIIGVMLVTSGGESGSFAFETLIFGLFAALGWGTSIYFIRKILIIDGTDGLGLLGIRNFLLCIEGIILYYLTVNHVERLKSTKEETIRSIKYLGFSGLLGDSFGAGIFFIAVQRIGAAIPTPISSTNPIFAILIGYMTGVELIKRKQLMGVLICVLGTIVIVL